MEYPGWLLASVDTNDSSPLFSPTDPDPGKVAGDVDVHDPAIIKVRGTYYLYSTGRGIPVITSTDRINFTKRGLAFPKGLPWCDPYVGDDKNIWAPEVRFVHEEFHLYYACSSPGARNSAIFLATSPSGLPGTFINKGKVFSTVPSSIYNAIDPGLLIDGDNWYMSFGSFWTGIYQFRVDPSTGFPSSDQFLNSRAPVRQLRLGQSSDFESSSSNVSLTHLAQRGGDKSIEASTIFKKGRDYWLFVSFDLCCKGADSTYRIMVGRSASPTGPFVDKDGQAMLDGGGSQVLAGHGNFHGPGGQTILSDNDGDFLVYHYYDAQGTAKLGINKLSWSSGWPVVV